jgi:platelet-activating factor acetylhydrolase
MHIYWPPLQALVTGTLWALGSNTVIPGVVDAPLIGPHEEPRGHDNTGLPELEKILKDAEGEVDNERMEVRRTAAEPDKLPLVIFSHGMAGMSQSYSHYLGSIASHGYVVAAVEHRDGSGPGSIVHFPDGKEEKVWHLQLQDLEYV